MGEQTDGLIAALVLDGKGGATRTDWDGVRTWRPEQGPLWVHLNRQVESTEAWVRNDSGVDPLIADALFDEKTRPRFLAFDSGVLLVLRGANLNPGAEPEDMVSLRIWAEKDRIITVRREFLRTIDGIVKSLDDKKGPIDISESVSQIIRGLIDRILPVILDLDERLDDLEDRVTNPAEQVDHLELVDARRELIALHQHLSPQRQAILEFAVEAPAWFSTRARRALGDAETRVERCISDLDTVRARAVLIQDEFATQQSEKINSRVYALTIIAAIFLPLTLVSGMLGMNVGGIPASDSAAGFLVVSAILGALGVGIYYLLRWMRWI